MLVFIGSLYETYQESLSLSAMQSKYSTLRNCACTPENSLSSIKSEESIENWSGENTDTNYWSFSEASYKSSAPVSEEFTAKHCFCIEETTQPATSVSRQTQRTENDFDSNILFKKGVAFEDTSQLRPQTAESIYKDIKKKRSRECCHCCSNNKDMNPCGSQSGQKSSPCGGGGPSSTRCSSAQSSCGGGQSPCGGAAKKSPCTSNKPHPRSCVGSRPTGESCGLRNNAKYWTLLKCVAVFVAGVILTKRMQIVANEIG